MAERKKRTGKDLTCSFCGKGQDEVLRLIAGPDVYICNECIALCDDIMDNSKHTFTRPNSTIHRKTPRALQLKFLYYGTL